MGSGSPRGELARVQLTTTPYSAMVPFVFSTSTPLRLLADISKVIQGNILPLGKQSYIRCVLVEIQESLEREKEMAGKVVVLHFPNNDGSYRLNAALGLLKCELQDVPRKEASDECWAIIREIIKELETKAYPDDDSELDVWRFGDYS